MDSHGEGNVGEFLKWKNKKSKRVDVGVGTGEESGSGPVGLQIKVY